MTRLRLVVIGTVLLIGVTVSPAVAQDNGISITPADGLLDGQTVEISATTTGSDYATLALCPAASAPGVGTATTDLLTIRNICVGLVCLHDGDTAPDLAEQISGDCPLAVRASPISTVSISLAVPRVTNDGTDCAVTECVIVFNTWTVGAAQGAVSAPVQFDDSEPSPTTIPTDTTPPESETTTALPTTTVELSSPTVTSTAAPAPTTVATEVLGAQESNDGELAVTGPDIGALAALGFVLLTVGGGAVRRSRRG